MTSITEAGIASAYIPRMKHARIRSFLDLPDDIGIDIAMISTCCAVGFAALIYLLAI